MIRVVLFLVLVGLLALGAAWLADRPGEVTILWLNRRIETSVLVAAAAVVFVAALSVILWSIVRALARAPKLAARSLRERRRARAYRAISGGLIAVGAGDSSAARRFAAEADRLAPREPLALLLNAQTAQLSGNRAAAEQAFRAMADRPDTRLIGLRGLHVEAERRDDVLAARHYAEQAAAAAPALPWAGQAVLDYRCATGDWAGALEALEALRHGGHVDKAAYRRRRAVLLTARALVNADSDAESAKARALEAVKLAPDLVPAAALAGRLLARAGEPRKAAKVLEAAWRANPHPDLAEAYAHLKPGDSARERLARVETLVKQRPNHVEAAFAVARAALDAQEFAAARTALGPLLAAPTQRAAVMMAELEETQHGDVGRAREWMARALRAPRDPVWTADGFTSDHWMPVSPVTGRLDAFQWKVPATDAVEDGRVIEQRADVPDTVPSAATAGQLGRNGPPPAAEDRTASADADASSPSAPPRGREPAVDPVIPLVHAPDDPGPAEPAPSASTERRRLFFW
jgi:HemY protein